ncbi:MAG: hypothetical protein JO360_13915 [Acidobacteria bacterium]|nr:hypothetical protein [Acidobacteriota bacterium]
MKRRTDIILACASFAFGALLSIRLMHFLFGGRIYMYESFAYLTPGWHLFEPVCGNPFGDLLVTTFDTVVFGGVIYFAARVMLWLLSAPRARYR